MKNVWNDGHSPIYIYIYIVCLYLLVVYKQIQTVTIPELFYQIQGEKLCLQHWDCIKLKFRENAFKTRKNT